MNRTISLEQAPRLAGRMGTWKYWPVNQNPKSSTKVSRTETPFSMGVRCG